MQVRAALRQIRVGHDDWSSLIRSAAIMPANTLHLVLRSLLGAAAALLRDARARAARAGNFASGQSSARRMARISWTGAGGVGVGVASFVHQGPLGGGDFDT
jgi:hypothetical protein